jgi:hypothetical protein
MQAGHIITILAPALLALASASRALQAGVPSLPAFASTNPDFCVEAQRRSAGVSVPVRNVIHTDFEAFVDSKPGIDPLETQQYVEYADGERSRPRRISCKLKSADHIRAVHGAAAASAVENPNFCREVNRATILEVWRGLDAATHSAAVVPPHRFMLDGDRNEIMGSRWVEPYPYVYAGAGGTVHVRAKALLVNWDDWRWKIAPASFRGTHYCHLIAPEYVRELILGKATAPTGSPAE